MYPTRAVRHAAWDALDFLFPVSCSLFFFFFYYYNCNGFESLCCDIIVMEQVGQYPRHVISLFFRLLYPWCWPSSCWNFIMSWLKAVLHTLLRVVFSSWEKVRAEKNS